MNRENSVTLGSFYIVYLPQVLEGSELPDWR